MLKNPETPLLILDTHVWVWLLNGSQQLARARSLPAIQRGAKENRLAICAISIWEVAMLERRGRLNLSGDCADWVRRALAAPGIRLLPLTPEIAVESTRLPGPAPTDPADCMIAATARLLGATLITRDKELLHYSQGGFLNAIAI
jgi:PIN domain nuclease of toxin-antitoxin system